ncbi:MAG: ABC transporter permease subunit [Planctomycetota bacterium]
MDGNAPWYERIPLFGNVGWPIAQKEVRSLIRRNRYFWSQFVYLAFLALAVIVTVTSSQGMVAQQEVVGRRLFMLFFMLQSFLVAVVFPAFAATSFSSEKAERSWELLVTTDLRSYELVWGKFLGIFGNVSISAWRQHGGYPMHVMPTLPRGSCRHAAMFP